MCRPLAYILYKECAALTSIWYEGYVSMGTSAIIYGARRYSTF